MMEQWYTFHTKPNAEYQVVDALLYRGVQTYLPEIKIPNVSKGKKKKPFFPCYLFGKIDLDVVGISHVKWTPGLRRIVSFGDRPVPIPDEVVALIRRKLGEVEANGGWPIHMFKRGDTVRITDGPFRNMVAIFDGSISQSERVQVLLNILGHASRVRIGVNDLEKASVNSEILTPTRPHRTRGKGRRLHNN